MKVAPFHNYYDYKMVYGNSNYLFSSQYKLGVCVFCFVDPLLAFISCKMINKYLQINNGYKKYHKSIYNSMVRVLLTYHRLLIIIYFVSLLPLLLLHHPHSNAYFLSIISSSKSRVYLYLRLSKFKNSYPNIECTLQERRSILIITVIKCHRVISHY